jgi:hypothetical protein
MRWSRARESRAYRWLGSLVGTAALLAVTACGTGGTVSDRSDPDTEPGTSDPSRGAEQGDREDVPSALDNPADPSFPEPLIDLDELVSGGPPPDGIPPIDDPQFQPASEVDWLTGPEPVLSLTVDGETRAYPLQVMTWHEIVNDTIPGTPIAVTYCPLCNSGVAFERTVDGEVLDFGTSGLLYADNLVMYDRQTESLWPQLTGEASVGHLTGIRLEAIPIGVVGWDQFLAAHPDALVLTRDTGFSRDYGTNPYVGYDDPDGALLVDPPGGTDERLPVKERVIGISVGNDALALTRARVAETGVVEVSVSGRELVVLHAPGQASALDSEQIPDGEEIGSIGVFVPRAAGRILTFQRHGDLFVDHQTGSRWNVLGESIAGPLEGLRLRPQRHLDTFWFAWVAFQPDTRLD